MWEGKKGNRESFWSSCLAKSFSLEVQQLKSLCIENRKEKPFSHKFIIMGNHTLIFLLWLYFTWHFFLNLSFLCMVWQWDGEWKVDYDIMIIVTSANFFQKESLAKRSDTPHDKGKNLENFPLSRLLFPTLEPLRNTWYLTLWFSCQHSRRPPLMAWKQESKHSHKMIFFLFSARRVRKRRLYFISSCLCAACICVSCWILEGCGKNWGKKVGEARERRDSSGICI